MADFIGQSSILEADVLGREGSRWVVRLADDVILSIDAPASAAGQRVVLSIRPEKIYLSLDAAAGENRFTATVIESVFKGPTASLLLTTDSGLGLSAVIANTTTMRRPLLAGDRVTCEIHPSDIAVLSEA